MARISVTVRKGRTHTRRENGIQRIYAEGATLQVSQHIYNVFRDTFRLEGEPADAPAPSPQSVAADRTAQRTAEDNADDKDVRIGNLVDQLAEVGYIMDIEKVGAWTDAELERAEACAARGGSNPPKFVKESVLQPDDAG